MKRKLAKTLAAFMAVLMIVTSAPLNITKVFCNKSLAATYYNYGSYE